MVQCQNCQTEIEEHVKFCSECGAAQGRKCEKCGSLVRATTGFCSECGNPQASVPRGVIGIGEKGYIGRAFILPGSVVLLGESPSRAKPLGTTHQVNLAVVDSVRNGHVTIIWHQTARLFDDAGLYRNERAALFELVPEQRRTGFFKTKLTEGMRFKGSFYETENSQVYLRDKCIVPAPKIDPGFEVLLSSADNPWASTQKLLAMYGWTTTSAMPNSLQLQKSGVNAVAAAFLFLFGVVPGILYLLVKQGRPKILNVSLETLSDAYQTLKFSGHGTSPEEGMEIVSRVQDSFVLERLNTERE